MDNGNLNTGGHVTLDQTDDSNSLFDNNSTSFNSAMTDNSSNADNSSVLDDSNLYDALFVEDLSDLGDNTFYVQEGVYLDEKQDVAIVDEKQYETMVDAEGYFTLSTGQKDEKGKAVVKKVKAKKMIRKEKKNFRIGMIDDENFGPLLPYIKDTNVTDINWNGSQLWVDDVEKGRYLADVKLTDDFIHLLSVRVADVVSATFNKYNPTLEAETDELRLTIVHESVSHTGRAISIRKTPAMKRIAFKQSILDGSYCSIEVANLLSNFVKAKCNIVICGLPGAGKTELVKYLTNYIAPHDRVITVEDTLEIHYAQINPGKDSLELKVGKTFSYTDAIKESLRLMPQWVLLSEARSTEVQYLLESVSTGTKCITTIHADDVRKIPDRIIHMVGGGQQADLILESVYNYFNVGILVDKRINPVSKRVERFISQVCVFDRSDGKNNCTMIVDNRNPVIAYLPKDITRKMELAGIDNPWAYITLPW